MQQSRLEALQQMVSSRPQDPRARFGLALEYERLERWDDVVRELRQYLAMTEDEGNAWGRLARALRRLSHDDEARAAYARGIEAANRHGHPTMAGELEDELDDM